MTPAMMSAMGFGSPEKAREIQVAPETRARAIGLMACSALPPGVDVVLTSFIVVAEVCPVVVNLIAHHNVGKIQIPAHPKNEILLQNPRF